MSLHVADSLPDLDFFGPAFASDPHAALRECRETSWAARSARGIEVLTYARCAAILSDDRFERGAAKMLDVLGEGAMASMAGPGRNLLTAEGADHPALR